MGEVPDQRAHQRVELALEVLRGEVRDERRVRSRTAPSVLAMPPVAVPDGIPVRPVVRSGGPLTLANWLAGSSQGAGGTGVVIASPSHLWRSRSSRPDHPIAIAPAGERVVVRAGGEVIAETDDALTLEEAGYAPVQYIPLADVDASVLRRSEHQTYRPTRPTHGLPS